MKFSIIIPAYHAEHTLEKCLDSVQQQTYPDFEAIIIDDGSKDGTSLIGKHFAQTDLRFQYIYQENQGVSVARNHGLRIAKGEFVVFLDSDDQYAPKYLQEFDALIEKHPEYDHFWCGFRTVDRSGNQLGCSAWAEETAGCCILDRSAIMSRHEKTLDAALWNNAYRKRILDEHHLRMDEQLSLGEDMLFNYAYLDICRTKIALINNPLYIFTKAENGSLDSKYRADLKEIYETINHQILVYLHNWHISREQLAKYYSSVFYTMERVLHNTYRPECTLTASEKRKFNQNNTQLFEL